MFSHIHDALQYMMLGAGEGRALMNTQKPVMPVVANRRFDVFNKPSRVKRKPSVWARM